MARARFITFEGGEGAGKSTQIRLLHEKLVGQGLNVISTREPGGTPEAEKIRTLLVDRAGGAWDPLSECLLLFAARRQHVRDLIAPALAAGTVVLCDRFTDSTRAYQGAGGGLTGTIIENIKQIAIGDLEPDLTFILDVPPEAGLARARRRLELQSATEDRFEGLDIGFHTRLRAHFLDIAEKNPERCRVIDATQSVTQIANLIWAEVQHGSV